jgi:transposase-like protein
MQDYRRLRVWQKTQEEDPTPISYPSCGTRWVRATSWGRAYPPRERTFRGSPESHTTHSNSGPAEPLSAGSREPAAGTRQLPAAIIYLTDHGRRLHRMDAPRTVQQAIVWFSNYQHCHDALVAVRWPDGVVKCPRCGSDKVTYLASAKVWKCYGDHPRAKFSLKVGTVFEDSPLPLQKWLPALWLLTNCQNGISSYELARAVGVTQKSAWFMLHRLRLALQQTQGGGKMGGHVEADETYIGGKARNMHIKKRKRMGISQGRSMAGKIVVMGLLERRTGDGYSRIRTGVLTGRKKGHIQPFVRATSNPEQPSTPTRISRIRDSSASLLIAWSITPRSKWTGRSTPTAAKTSGAC